MIDGSSQRVGHAQRPGHGKTAAARRSVAGWLALTVLGTLLAGCAGTTSDVRTWVAPTFTASAAGTRSYVLAASPLPGQDDTSDGQAALAASVERALAAYGFVAAPEGAARYRLALSAESRPARVSVAYRGCGPQGRCEAAGPEPFGWPGRTHYRHTLTLRWFDRASGQEAYKASAALVDSQPALGPAVPALVASALARLPFPAADAAKWRVKLREPAAGTGAPQAVEVLAVPQAQGGG